MRIKLEVTLPQGDTFARQFEARSIRIGRNPDCEFQFSDEQASSVSWSHARVDIQGEGALISDLNSTNGTFLNGVRLDSRQSLSVGDKVKLGREGPVLQVVGLVFEESDSEQGNSSASNSPLGYARDIDGVREKASPSSDQEGIAQQEPGQRRPPPIAPVQREDDLGRQLDISRSGESKEDESSSNDPSTRSLLIHHKATLHRNLSIAIVVGSFVLGFAVFVLFLFPGYLRVGYHDSAKRSLIDRVQASVVQIKTPSGIGSGFVLDAEGTIVTNHHVVSGDQSATAIFQDGAEQPIEGFVAYSVGKDLVFLRVQPHSSFPDPLPLSADPPLQGEAVLAFGSPEGFRGSVSEGLVSAEMRRGSQIAEQLRTTVRQDGREVNINVYRDILRRDDDAMWIQTTASVLPGNSGGPLVNFHGQVVGVNSFGPNETLNFASAAINIRHLIDTAGDDVRPLDDLPER